MSPRPFDAIHLEPIEWDGPLDVTAHGANRSPVAVSTGEPLAHKPSIRDRYIAARFPGRFRRTDDLADARDVIDTARLYFDEAKMDRALELLDLAILQAPSCETLQLARLEIAFVLRQAELFSSCAREFRTRHGDSKAWIEVARLGRTIAPSDELFGARQGPRLYDHYGPWPHTPNWIGASWDLSSEVLAAEFRAAMSRETAVQAEASLKNAA